MNSFGNPQQPQQQQQQQGGSQPSNTGTGGGLFGGGTGTGITPSGGGLFGSGTTSTTPAPGTTPGSLFGAQPSNPTPAPPGGGGSIFGSAANPTTSTTSGTTTNPSPFGSGTTNSGSLFGGGTTNTPSLFGSGATTTATPSLFGSGPTTTPSIFGSGTTGTGSTFFGVPKPADAKEPTKPDTGGNGTTTPAPPAFGGGFFGGQKPAENKDAPKPATSGGLFGGPPSTNKTSDGLFGGQPRPTGDSSTSATTPATTGIFGLPQKPADSATTSTSTSTATPAFGGGLFGPKKPETSTSGTSTPVPPTTGGFSFGGTAGGGLFGPATNKDATKPEEKKDTTPATSTSLFGPPKDGDKKNGTVPGTSAATNSSTLGGLFGKPAEKKDTPAVTTTTSIGDKSKAPGTSSPLTITAQPPSMLRGKTIEEIVNKWSSDLETQVKEFSKFATEVAVWDRALIENGNSLAALMNEMLVAEREQADIDQALDHVEQQQRDLMATLEIYEKTAEESFNTQSGSIRALDTGPADTERDRNYMLAADLYTHLDDLSGSLTQMIDAVNALSTGPGVQQDGGNDPSGGANGLNEDPMTQIAQILSSHLESLQWIDGTVRELENNVSEVEKRVREAGLSVNGGGSGGHVRSTRTVGYGLR